MRAKSRIRSSTGEPFEDEPGPLDGEEVVVPEGAAVWVGEAKTRPLLVTAFPLGSGVEESADGDGALVAEVDLGRMTGVVILVVGDGPRVSSIWLASKIGAFRRCERTFSVTRAF